MTVTRLWHAGCESSGASSAVEFSALNGGATISNTWARSGSYSLRCTNAYGCYGLVNLPVGVRQIRAGFYMKSAGQSSGTPYLFVVSSATGRLMGLKIVSGEARVTLEVGGSNQGTTANYFPDGDGHHWGVDVKVHSTAGWVRVYRDGVEVLAFSGNTGDADIAAVKFGNDAAAYLAQYTYYDDMYIDVSNAAEPTAPPAYRFLWAAANGNGSHSDWMRSDGDQVDNYALVDEAVQNGDTDYVYASAAALVDSYAMGDVTVPPGYVCTAVCPYPIARKTGAGNVQLAAFVRSGSATATGTAVGLDTSYAPKLFTRFEVDPATGAAWTQGGLNGMECGFVSAGTFV